MPADNEDLLRRMIGGDATVLEPILDRAQTGESAPLLVAAALVADEPERYLRTGVSAACQRSVSGPADASCMTPEDSHTLIRQLIGGDPAAAGQILVEATTSTEPLVLTAAALIEPGTSSLLDRATSAAATTRDRQLAALAAAHLAGDHDRVSALAREHLLDHPDSVLAAWIAAGATRPTTLPAGTAPTTTAKESS